MKVISGLFLSLALGFFLSQTLCADENNAAFYNFASKLNLRSGPGVKGPVIGKIPYGARVELVSSKHQLIPQKFHGISGYWSKVKYQNQTGYVFGGYLVKLPAPSLRNKYKFLDDYVHSKMEKSAKAIVRQKKHHGKMVKERTYLLKGGHVFIDRSEEECEFDQTLKLHQVSFQDAFLLAKRISSYLKPTTLDLKFDKKIPCPENPKDTCVGKIIKVSELSDSDKEAIGNGPSYIVWATLDKAKGFKDFGISFQIDSGAGLGGIHISHTKDGSEIGLWYSCH